MKLHELFAVMSHYDLDHCEINNIPIDFVSIEQVREQEVKHVACLYSEAFMTDIISITIENYTYQPKPSALF